jgi:hypothetical protein
VSREGLLPRRAFLLGGLALAGGTVLSGTLTPGRAAAAEPLPIIDCDTWGARPSRVAVPIHAARPVRILVHHTATPNVTDVSRDAADRLARSIQNFHMDRRGWLDSGQHFTISRGGFVLEGRRRSLEVLRAGDRQVEGAHCTGQNLVAVGIENEGLYLDVEPPVELWNRLRELCAYICAQYGIEPTEIYGHRDYKDTACPGDTLYGLLPRLRGEVAAVLGQVVDAASAIKVSWPLLRVGDRGAPVLAAQYLLRAAGLTGVVPDGRFGEPLADVVRRFQAERRFEEVNGLIGGESWPALARTVRLGEGGDAERAVEALLAGRSTESVPDVVTRPVWQRLLA